MGLDFRSVEDLKKLNKNKKLVKKLGKFVYSISYRTLKLHIKIYKCMVVLCICPFTGGLLW